MKLFFIISIVALLMSSCEMEQITYSCDPDVDAIVKSGAIEVSSINLAELLEYDSELQKAIYRSMKPEMKKKLWIEKFDKLIQNYSFSKKELEHIIKLKSYVIKDSFESSMVESEIYGLRTTFENEWKNYAIEELNWDRSMVGFVVSSLDVDEQTYKESVGEQKELTIQMLNASCSCSSESSYCGAGSCHIGGCSQTSGCGWFWHYRCNGYCN